MKHAINFKQFTVATVAALGFGWGVVAHAGAGVGATVGTGPDSYHRRGVDLTLWSNDGLLNGGISRRKSESGGSSANDVEETQASLGLQLDSGVGLTGNYDYNDEPDLEIETVGAGMSLPLNRAQSSRLYLDYRTTDYRSKGQLRRQPTLTLTRNEYAVGFDHSFTDAFTLGASYSSYQYNRDTAPLTTLFQMRRQRFLSTNAVLLDLLDYGWTVNANWRFTEGQTLGAFYNRACDIFGVVSSVATLSDKIALGEQWSFDLSASHIVDTESSGNYYDLSLHYYFD